MPGFLWRRALILAVLGFGIFQLLSGVVGALFWLLTGDWRPYTPVVIVIAFAASLPVAYMLWERHGPKP